MSKRITKKQGREMREHELECQKLNKKGIRSKVSRSEKRRRMKLSKTKQFIEMLKDRGGYFKQKEGVK